MDALLLPPPLTDSAPEPEPACSVPSSLINRSLELRGSNRGCSAWGGRVGGPLHTPLPAGLVPNVDPSVDPGGPPPALGSVGGFGSGRLISMMSDRVGMRGSPPTPPPRAAMAEEEADLMGDVW